MSAPARVGWRYLTARAVGYRRSALETALTRTGRRVRARFGPGPASGPVVPERVPGALTPTTPTREVALVVPDGLDRADRRALRQRDVTAVPGQFVARWHGVRVVGRDGWVLHEGRPVAGIWQEHRAAPVVSTRGLPAPTVLPGTTVSLLMPWLPNYYHWTVQALPRALAVLDHLGGRVGAVDRWLLPGHGTAYEEEWLDLLGIPAQRRVRVAGRREVFAPEELLVASVPGRNRWVPPEAVERIRELVADRFPTAALPGGGRRLLVHRPEPRRVLLNVEEVLAALTARGFEVVDPSALGIAEEVALFGAADVVVGVHGAGLTNLVHCRPGTDVVEIAPRGLVFPTFVKLAAAAGVRHHLVPGREPRLPWPLRFPDMESDVVADLDRLVAVVDGVLAGRPVQDTTRRDG